MECCLRYNAADRHSHGAAPQGPVNKKMSSTAIIAIIGVFAAGGLLGVLYYVSTLAKNVYQIKVQMKDDLGYEMERLRDHVEKEMVQRQKWIIRDVTSTVEDKHAALEAEVSALTMEIKLDLADVNEKIRKLQVLQQSAATRSTRPAGSVAKMDSAFSVDSLGRMAPG